jgi:prepilin-type N-terminal cleavage/methylation domain-containing protein
MFLIKPKTQTRNPHNAPRVSSFVLRHSSFPRGFTLIEIMVVVSIIIILAAIGLGVGAAVRRAGADRQTKTNLDTARQVMSEYLKNHAEPSAANAIAALLAQDRTAILSLPGATKNPPEIDDGYNNAIQYVPGSSGRPGYFRSPGPDGQPNTADDVFSSPVGN